MIVKLTGNPKTPFPPSAIGTGCIFVEYNQFHEISQESVLHNVSVYRCLNVQPSNEDIEVEGENIMTGDRESFTSSEIIVVNISQMMIERRPLEINGARVDNLRNAASQLKGSDGETFDDVINMLIKLADEAERSAE